MHTATLQPTQAPKKKSLVQLHNSLTTPKLKPYGYRDAVIDFIERTEGERKYKRIF